MPSARDEQYRIDLVKKIYGEVRAADYRLYTDVIQAASGQQITHDLSLKAAAGIEAAMMSLVHRAKGL